MRRIGNLFEQICDMENLKLAHVNARKKKTHYKEVIMVDNNMDYYINKLYLILKNKTYKNSKYKKFIKRTKNGKIREIYKLPYFPDRIIHHAIMQIVEPIWKNMLIRDTYSSIKDRGIHDGIKRIEKALLDKNNTEYCLKLDILKYYPSIDNTILKQVIRKKIKDKNLLWLLDEIIDSTVGVPIGNYLSQYFGNIYLNELDHLLKNKCKYYFRYCDDMILLHNDKKFLHAMKNEIKDYLLNQRNLKLKSNWQIFPTNVRGIDFLGYRFFYEYKLLRKSIKKNFIKLITKIKVNHNNLTTTEIINAIMSYYGWIKYGNCLHLEKKYIDDNILKIVDDVCFRDNIKNPLLNKRY